MANVTISGLPSLSTLTDASVLPTDSGADTYKVSGLTMKTYFQTAIPAANVTGTVASATVAASANSVAGANVTGTVASATTATTAATVTSAAQSNITSVGTLTSLAVSGNTSTAVMYAGDNATPGSSFLTVDANGVSLGLAAGQLITVTSANGIDIGGTGGVTIQGAVGATVSLGGGTSGDINLLSDAVFSANVDLGTVANVHIAGGSNGQVLSTDGSGTLSWVSGGGATGNIANTNYNGNANTVLGGDGVWRAITTASVNKPLVADGNGGIASLSAWTLDNTILEGPEIDVSNTFTGNLQVFGTANLGPIGNIAITGGSSGQFLQTDGSGNLSWSNVRTLLAAEYHVSPSGSDTAGDGTQDSPYANVQYAVDAAIAAATPAKVIVHSGVYAPNIAISDASNISIVAAQSDNGQAVKIGNVAITGNTTEVRLVGLRTGAVEIDVTGDGTVWLDTVNVTRSFIVDRARYVELRDSVTQIIDQSGGGVQNRIGANGSSSAPFVKFISTAIRALRVYGNGYAYLDTCNDVDFGISVTENATITAYNSSIANAASGGDAIGSSANTTVTLVNTTLRTASGLPAKANISGNYIFSDAIYDTANTVLGTNLGAVANVTATFNAIDVQSSANLGAVGDVTITGGANGQVLRTDGSGNLSWANTAAGANGLVQFADNGQLAWDSVFSYSTATERLSVGNVSVANVANITTANIATAQLNTVNFNANVNANVGNGNVWSINGPDGASKITVDNTGVGILDAVVLPANITVAGGNPVAATDANIAFKIPVIINGNTYYLALTAAQ